MLRKRIRQSLMSWSGVREIRRPRAQRLESTVILVRLAVIVAAASLVASSGSVFAQSGSGCTGSIGGAIRLVESPGGPLCSAATTGPNDASGLRTIGQIL